MRTSTHINRAGPAAPMSPTTGGSATQAAPALAAPDVARTGPAPRVGEAPTTPSALGAFLGRAAKAVAAVTLGTALVTGTAGCALTPSEPYTPAMAQQHVHRFVQTDAGWAARGLPDAAPLPAHAARILEQAAEARHSVDGQSAWVLDPDVGGYGFTSAWSGFEVRDIVQSLEGLLATGDLKAADPRVANAFLHEMADIFGEVGPTQDAGLGFTRSYLNQLEDAVLALDAQVRAD